jgi:hypothetical protein
MRHGLPAPDTLALAREGQAHAAIAARLRELELRAMERSGRLDALRREAGVEAEGVDASTKRKIIEGLGGTRRRRPTE